VPSGLERAVVVLGLGLGLAAGFACSVPSVKSDVSLMKKTPFYHMMRLNGDGNLSSQP